MTRRERLERRIERRKDWAEKAENRAQQHYATSNRLVENIPFGQPILVGHHSERAHRNTLERSRNHMFAMVDENKKAAMHESKAENLGHLLDKAIFSDDSDAVEAIQERIDANEAKRERMKKINAMYRKGDAAGLAELGYNLDTLQAALKDAYSWCQQPHPAYELQNLGQRISTDKKRLEFIKAQQARAARAEASPTGVTVEDTSGGYCRIIFAEKPDRSILVALKAAGFYWGSGSWCGKREAIPACVLELLPQVA